MLAPGYRQFEIAKRLLSVKQAVAQTMTDEFFVIHPEWELRYGERGRKYCTADACFHIEFLAGAVEAGSPDAFVDYALWTARMLGARGIDAHTLEENLAQLKKHLSGHFSMVEQELLALFLDPGRAACIAPRPAFETQPPDAYLDLAQHTFVAAILSGHRKAALGIVEEALHHGTSLVDVYVEIFSRSLYEVGSLWEQNKISVAQEHLATAVTQYVIASPYSQLTLPSPFRGNMVVTGVAGEGHQIGANLVADAMEANGWNVRFLGSNVPHSAVLSEVEKFSASVLCVSTTLVANLPSAAELILSVRTKMGEGAPRIVLGGAAYRLTPDFVQGDDSATIIPNIRKAIALLCP